MWWCYVTGSERIYRTARVLLCRVAVRMMEQRLTSKQISKTKESHGPVAAVHNSAIVWIA